MVMVSLDGDDCTEIAMRRGTNSFQIRSRLGQRQYLAAKNEGLFFLKHKFVNLNT